MPLRNDTLGLRGAAIIGIDNEDCTWNLDNMPARSTSLTSAPVSSIASPMRLAYIRNVRERVGLDGRREEAELAATCVPRCQKPKNEAVDHQNTYVRTKTVETLHILGSIRKGHIVIPVSQY